MDADKTYQMMKGGQKWLQDIQCPYQIQQKYLLHIKVQVNEFKYE